MTVATFIKDALRTIGAIASGETPTASESADALSTLNRLLSSWSAEGFLIYESKRESFDLVASQSSYTWGSGANFNSARPYFIDKVNVEKDDQEYPVEILRSTSQWASVGNKTLTSTLPSKIYASGTYPNETLYVWPVPTEANSLVIHSQKPFTAYAATSETVTLPPGYEEAVLYNFCVRLAPEFGVPLDPTIATLANDLKANIQRKNIKPSYMKNDAYRASGASYDIYRGE